MSKGKAVLNSSRTEFLPDNQSETIEYNRSGGCFVTTKKAIFFLFLAIFLLALVIVLMYYCGPDRNENEQQIDSNDIEAIINRLGNISSDSDFRLNTNTFPIYYRLQIHPILDEYDPKNNTFTGTVSITIQTKIKTKQIVLHAVNLTIEDIVISTPAPDIQSLSQIDVNLTQTVLPNGSNSNDTNSGNKTNAYSNSTKQTSNKGITNNKTEREATVTNVESSKLTTEAGEEQKNAIEKSPTEQRELYLDIRSQGYERNAKFMITVASNLQPFVNYTVKILFSGRISNNLVGLYKTSYLDEKGEKKWLATTYFQPIYARRVFPCFDEPEFKAPFEISIARRTNMTTLSNMPIRQTEGIANMSRWVWDHFQVSPPMSTYLVAFTIFDFTAVRSRSKAGPVMKIWAPRHLLNYTSYAMSLSERMIPFLEKYFGIKYPLRKIDFIAVPDLAANAISNWGLVSFRGTSIILDPNDDDFENKEFVFNSVGHELAHQWFGDLVGVNWWSDVWLNEGFATYIVNSLKNQLEPSWESYNRFLIKTTHPILREDSLKTTHSLYRETTSPSQVEHMFDNILRKKGGCLLKMVNFTLGEPTFRKGVQKYLQSQLYCSSNGSDFWNSVAEDIKNKTVLPKNVSLNDIMGTWTIQDGYPVVTVKRNYVDHTAKVTQKRFVEQDINSGNLWIIPISYISKYNKTVRYFWLQNQTQVIPNYWDFASNSSWILFNIQQTGFYRVNYDERNWKLLQKQLEDDPGNISVANRAQLLDDALELSRLGLLNYQISLNLTKYLATKENNNVPWSAALYNLNEIGLILSGNCCFDIFQNYMTKLMANIYHSLGTTENPTDSDNNKLLRSLILQTSCDIQYEHCEDWAKEEFAKWMETENPDLDNPIPPNLRQTVLCTAVRSGGMNEWFFLWNRTLSPLISPADLKNAYLSLGCTRITWLITKYLELSLNGSVSLENVPYVWESFNHPSGLHVAFKFLRSNWNQIHNKYKNVFTVMKAIVEKFLSKLSSEIDLQDLTTFYKLEEKDLNAVSPLMQRTVDKIKLRIDWTEDHLEEVVSWLENNG